MRILGIDPGSRITGFGIVDCVDGELTHVASGAIQLKFKEIPPRLVLLQNEIERLIAEFQPERCAIEAIFVHKNPNSALKLGQARGVALCSVARANLPIYEYAPRVIKHTVTGGGNADKHAVQEAVKSLFLLDGKIQEDSADALAIAFTHCKLDLQEHA